MDLHGHRILIIDSQRVAFARNVQQAIRREGAVAFVSRDPVNAIERAKRIDVSAAPIGADHWALVGRLGIPVQLVWSAATIVSPPLHFHPSVAVHNCVSRRAINGA